MKRPRMTFISKERTFNSVLGPQVGKSPSECGQGPSSVRSTSHSTHSLLAAPGSPHPRDPGQVLTQPDPLEGVTPEWLQTSRPQGQRTPSHPSQFKHGARERTADHPEGWCGAQAGPRLSLTGRTPDRPLSPQCPQSQWVAGLGSCDDQ